MDINHNQVVYIPKGEHDDPHELPQQQELEGSTEIEHTLYSHTDSISPEINSNHFKSLNIITNIFKTMKRYMNQTLTQLGMKLITPYTHILIMILNMVYLKMLLIAII